jgi:predicted nucleic acid-binding protein
MAVDLRYAVDTNILLRVSFKTHVDHPLIANAIRHLVIAGAELCYTTQSMGEFWNVSTRPLERNGFGISTSLAEEHLAAIENTMTVVPEDPLVYDVWRRLLVRHNIRGVQVHDAHLAATLEVHGIRNLLTFNGSDFKRFSKITAVHPADAEPMQLQ